MPTRSWLAVALAAGITAPSQLSAQQFDVPGQRSPSAPRSETLFPPSDAAKEIDTALALAKKDGKRVLLDFGADWCIDCRVLEPILKQPEIAKFLAAHFHLVKIDLGRVLPTNSADLLMNADIATKYGVGTSAVGIPAFVLLDRQGKIVKPRNEVKWRTARFFVPEEVLSYLKDLASTK